MQRAIFFYRYIYMQRAIFLNRYIYIYIYMQRAINAETSNLNGSI